MLTSSRDHLLDLVKGGAGVLEDADHDPELGGFSVARDLAVKHAPALRVGIGPGLHDESAGAVGSPHLFALVGDVALGDVFGHGAADEAHGVLAGLAGGEGGGGCEAEGEEERGEKLHVGGSGGCVFWTKDLGLMSW